MIQLLHILLKVQWNANVSRQRRLGIASIDGNMAMDAYYQMCSETDSDECR